VEALVGDAAKPSLTADDIRKMLVEKPCDKPNKITLQLNKKSSILRWWWQAAIGTKC